MKKLFALVLAAAMLLCCVCYAETATEEGVITLYLTGISMDGENVFNAADIGMNMMLTLNPDGTVTGTASAEGEESASTGTWVEDGDNAIITIDDQPMVMSASEDGLQLVGTMESDGVTQYLYFGFEPATPSFNAPAIVAAADASAFNGNWTASFISAFGMNLNMEAAMAEGLGELLGADGTDLTLKISDGNVTVFGTDAGAFTFADGHLVMDLGSEELASFTQTVDLCEDGSLLYSVMGMNIYFSAAE